MIHAQPVVCCFYIDLSWFFGLQTTTNDSCLIHIIFDQNDGWVVDSPIVIVIIKSFFKDIPNGRMGWSWKGLKIIVAGSLQLDIR